MWQRKYILLIRQHLINIEGWALYESIVCARLHQLTMVSGNFLCGPVIMIITSAGALALVMSGFFRQPVRENKIPRALAQLNVK